MSSQLLLVRKMQCWEKSYTRFHYIRRHLGISLKLCQEALRNNNVPDTIQSLINRLVTDPVVAEFNNTDNEDIEYVAGKNSTTIGLENLNKDCIYVPVVILHATECQQQASRSESTYYRITDKDKMVLKELMSTLSAEELQKHLFVLERTDISNTEDRFGTYTQGEAASFSPNETCKDNVYKSQSLEFMDTASLSPLCSLSRCDEVDDMDSLSPRENQLTVLLTDNQPANGSDIVSLVNANHLGQLQHTQPRVNTDQQSAIGDEIQTMIENESIPALGSLQFRTFRKTDPMLMERISRLFVHQLADTIKKLKFCLSNLDCSSILQEAVTKMTQSADEILIRTKEAIPHELQTALGRIKSVKSFGLRYGRLQVSVNEEELQEQGDDLRTLIKKVVEATGCNLSFRDEDLVLFRKRRDLCVQQGSSLHKKNGDRAGTLAGFCLAEDNSVANPIKVFAITCGHVALNSGPEIYTEKNRLLGISDFQKVGNNELDSLIDIAAISIDCSRVVECTKLIMNKFGEPCTRGSVYRGNMADLANSQTKVYKIGAITKTTEGEYIGIDIERGCKVHIIKSKSVNEPFAEPGDSGSAICMQHEHGEVKMLFLLQGILEGTEPPEYVGVSVADCLECLQTLMKTEKQLQICFVKNNDNSD